MTKRIALLVPCYNAARFVDGFCQMVRAQTRPYDEVLFFDDASTDDTVLRIEAAGFTVLRGNENRGAAHARNRLLAATTADYVHLHDVDDDLDPAFVASLLPLADANTAACCALCRRWPDGRIERLDRFQDMPSTPAARVAYFQQVSLSFNAAIYPRSVLLRFGGFNEAFRMAEDMHLLLQLVASDLAYAYYDRALTTWRLRPDSTSHHAGQHAVMVASLDCLADLCGKWKIELRRQLGPPLLEMAWSLRRWHDRPQSIRAARLAQYCGQRVVANRGRRILWLSRVFGPALYYRLFPAPSIAAEAALK